MPVGGGCLRAEQWQKRVRHVHQRQAKTSHAVAHTEFLEIYAKPRRTSELNCHCQSSRQTYLIALQLTGCMEVSGGARRMEFWVYLSKLNMKFTKNIGNMV